MIVEALKRLEYRGYDSAGIATIEHGHLDRRRAEGKLVNLEDRLRSRPLIGHTGIGHTRWATHGVPNESNAHPHFSDDRVAVVHNGIIENFRELRDELIADGFHFASQTDTEVIAHLVARGLRDGLAPKEAARAAISRLRGAFALAILFKDEENLLVGARNGPPLAIGHGDGENYLGSDAIALAPFTNTITYLEDGDWCALSHDGIDIYDVDGRPVERAMQKFIGSSLLVDKGNHRHFMLKEIYEQPEVISHTLANYVDFVAERALAREALPFDFAGLERIAISACGTAYLAGLVAKYWFERYARLPVDIDIASEFRYREMPMPKNGLALFISQSGETADTLASLRYCRAEGQHIGAVVNVRGSTIAREADIVFPTLAGPEIGVASTKAFTCQLSVLAALAVAAGRARGELSAEAEAGLVRALGEAPRFANQALKLEGQIEKIAHDLSKVRHVLYLGRDTSYPLAMEGALKLKEISYIHAEGYAAGELKHGPIALIDEDMPVVVVAPHDHIYEKTVSNMQEVAARGGRIILITDERGAAECSVNPEHLLVLPDMPEIIAPIVYALPVQLIAYHTAVIMGTDVDQPRNLAKSVTVE
ncbi:MAG: glutamine--fructose-6-phosphate aminotransferase [isomerizing] [Alphaproteobacteria bacterium]|nr:MAG: glutamine--fructose-6-phosphate aminotransferase [isomerizing] [Alphaproteobacteria bacterium]